MNNPKINIEPRPAWKAPGQLADDIPGIERSYPPGAYRLRCPNAVGCWIIGDEPIYVEMDFKPGILKRWWCSFFLGWIWQQYKKPAAHDWHGVDRRKKP